MDVGNKVVDYSSIVVMLSLKGVNEINPLNLKGESYHLGNKYRKVNKDYERWKNRMFNRLILPILQKKWKEIYENIFLISILKEQLDKFKDCNDIEFYRNILTFVERVYNEHEELTHLEKLIYSDDKGTSMLYKTTMIRIAAEYQIYINVFGKPESDEYDSSIIEYIKQLMMKDDIMYSDIKNSLIKKYLA